MAKNKIEVYSLNENAIEFMHQSLLTNFVDFTYEPTQIPTPALPTLDHSEYAIIIQTPLSDDVSEEEYKHFYNTPLRENWDTKRYIMVSDNEMKSFHGYLLLMMQMKFNIEVKEEWQLPNLDISK